MANTVNTVSENFPSYLAVLPTLKHRNASELRRAQDVETDLNQISCSGSKTTTA